MKKAITITTLAISIIIISILATVVTTSIYSTINFSKLSTWANELTYIQDTLNNKLQKTSVLPLSQGTTSINLNTLTSDEISEQFKDEIIVDGSVELEIIDLGLLNITNTVYGNKTTENDVYAYSETTKMVYYVDGININNKIYYTATNRLLDMYEIERKGNNNINTVIYEPNKIGYTNEPISVIVKVPNIFTEVVVTTSDNSILIGSPTLNGIVNEYIVNTNNVAENYIITVTYTNAGEEYTSTYEVNGYDNEAPTLNASKNENNQFIVQANDNIKIKELKYIEGEIEEANINSYFENNGKQVVNARFKSDEDVTKYTVFAKDMAGNFSYIVLSNVITINIGDYIEYDVAYTDMFKTNNVFSKLNGWRIVDFDLNNDGTYSNVKIISTGIPARFCYTYDASSDWFVTDNNKLDEFKSVLTSKGDGQYSFYSGDKTHYALQMTAGLYYNFGMIKFAYSESVRGHNLGYFKNIVLNGIQYNSTTNSTVEKTGNELFNLLGDNATVRVLTLPEINLATVGNDIDYYGQSDNDVNGIYILNKINQVPYMENFEPYTGGSNVSEYVLASPHPNFQNERDAVKLSNSGLRVHYAGISSVQTTSSGGAGLRPLIVTKTGVKVKFKDRNSNKVPEIQIVN